MNKFRVAEKFPISVSKKVNLLNRLMHWFIRKDPTCTIKRSICENVSSLQRRKPKLKGSLLKISHLRTWFCGVSKERTVELWPQVAWNPSQPSRTWFCHPGCDCIAVMKNTRFSGSGSLTPCFQRASKIQNCVERSDSPQGGSEKPSHEGCSGDSRISELPEPKNSC